MPTDCHCDVWAHGHSVSCGYYRAPRCNDNGGQGIAAGHVCRCTRAKGHPLDADRPHGCSCGALW